MSTVFTAIDLFSGAGGLSIGIQRAGFKIVTAVEADQLPSSAYQLNFPDTKVIQQDITLVPAHEISGDNSGIDLLAACPPCQGFSSLTSKYRRDDPRNFLLCEVSRIVRELSPKTIMLENVPGLAKKGKKILDTFLETLDEEGYFYEYGVVEASHYGAPQYRRRFVLLASKISPIRIPKPTHGKQEGLQPQVTVEEALKGLGRPIVTSKAKEFGGPRALKWHVFRQLSPINRERLKYIQQGGSRDLIPEHLRPNCHKNGYKGYNNVYGRMSANEPSPTITGGCTVMSKGRFIHPTEDRCISVREAARLQGFPDEFDFGTEYIDHVCKMIGNAFPVQLANSLATVCMKNIQSESLDATCKNS